jgi:hypothetical protein
MSNPFAILGQTDENTENENDGISRKEKRERRAAERAATRKEKFAAAEGMEIETGFLSTQEARMNARPRPQRRRRPVEDFGAGYRRRI